MSQGFSEPLLQFMVVVTRGQFKTENVPLVLIDDASFQFLALILMRGKVTIHRLITSLCEPAKPLMNWSL